MLVVFFIIVYFVNYFMSDQRLWGFVFVKCYIVVVIREREREIILNYLYKF